ncbi:hypothetical protein Tco_0978602 [Tanacetum coccineum]|uniref:Uncharacterized protein n=1 Tax=Tanacetum coccineum TaxID=301880 RepID=A0ABQ5ENI5_9ASTR
MSEESLREIAVGISLCRKGIRRRGGGRCGGGVVVGVGTGCGKFIGLWNYLGWRYDDDDDGGLSMVVAVGWWKWRVGESELVDRIDRRMGSLFGLRRICPPEKFSGGGEWWPAAGELAGEEGWDRE